MARYSHEQKDEALKMIEELGVSKTSEAMGISTATLFKWKREAAPQAPSRSKKATTSKKKTTMAKDTSKKAAVEAAKELLQDDGTSFEKIQQLEAENAHLRDTNAKLRKALAALID